MLGLPAAGAMPMPLLKWSSVHFALTALLIALPACMTEPPPEVKASRAALEGASLAFLFSNALLVVALTGVLTGGRDLYQAAAALVFLAAGIVSWIIGVNLFIEASEYRDWRELHIWVWFEPSSGYTGYGATVVIATLSAVLTAPTVGLFFLLAHPRPFTVVWLSERGCLAWLLMAVSLLWLWMIIAWAAVKVVAPWL